MKNWYFVHKPHFPRVRRLTAEEWMVLMDDGDGREQTLQFSKYFDKEYYSRRIIYCSHKMKEQFRYILHKTYQYMFCV